MQVRFVKSVPIDIKLVDKSQYGKLIRVHPSVPPSFDPKGEKPKELPPEWHVRIGVPIDLPEYLARAMIEQRVAEKVPQDQVPDVKFVVLSPEEVERINRNVI